MKSRVLVVDDEPTIRQLFEIALRDEGYDVTAVENGVTARNAIQNQHFDVVFLDILLPDCYGSDIYEAIKANPGHPTICVLTAITSRDTERMDDYQRLIHLGAEDLFLRKPLTHQEILEVTRKLASQHAHGDNASP